MNYPHRDQLPVHIDNANDNALFDFFGSELYRQIRANGLALLRSDINEIGHSEEP